MTLKQEQQLISQAKAGNKDALGQLWDKLTPKLFGYLINTLKDKTLAEDILQSTWLKAIEALPKFTQTGNGISPWLFTIAKNECRQHWRKIKNEDSREITENDIVNDDRILAENKILTEQLLNLLSEDDRELLRLRYIADMPVKNIARTLNINFVAVRVRLHRAIKRAQTALTSKNI